ncbi:MAG: 23S rRNA (adenine(2503)-C(2))-methyltransferase RlmN [Bacteroidales bacterium]
MNEKMAPALPLTGLNLIEIADSLEKWGIDRKYASRVAYWIYKKRMEDITSMTSIAGAIRKRLSEHFITGITPPSKRVASSDGSVKYLFSFPGGREVETVFIPEAKRNTVCVSAQCGCARACLYCRTGEMGFHGNLTAGEIVNQVLALPEAATVSHVVFMGMGEPLDNLSEVIRAIEIFTAEWGLAIGNANITVSTVGIIPSIEELLSSTRCNLTLSLVSPVAEERKRLVPAEALYPAAMIIELLKSAPPSKKRRFTVAYMMLDGVNDSERHLEALKELIRGSAIRVNLLTYHPHGDMSFRPSRRERMEQFRKGLLAAGISASIRKSRGEDIAAACGMLISK